MKRRVVFSVSPGYFEWSEDERRAFAEAVADRIIAVAGGEQAAFGHPDGTRAYFDDERSVKDG